MSLKARLTKLETQPIDDAKRADNENFRAELLRRIHGEVICHMSEEEFNRVINEANSRRSKRK